MLPLSPNSDTDELIPHGHDAEALVIVPEIKGWATQTYMLVLDFGWGQRTVAENMYEADAKGIAHALSAALGCRVERP